MFDKGAATTEPGLAPDSLWRGIRERYRFGALHLLKPAPVFYMQLVLKRRVAQRVFIRNLFMHLVFTIIFTVIVFSQRKVIDVFRFSSALTIFFEDQAVWLPQHGKHIDLSQINSQLDATTWAAQAFLPAVLPPRAADGRTYIRGHQLVGSPRLVYRRVVAGNCQGSTRLPPAESHSED